MDYMKHAEKVFQDNLPAFKLAFTRHLVSRHDEMVNRGHVDIDPSLLVSILRKITGHEPYLDPFFEVAMLDYFINEGILDNRIKA